MGLRGRRQLGLQLPSEGSLLPVPGPEALQLPLCRALRGLRDPELLRQVVFHPHNGSHPVVRLRPPLPLLSQRRLALCKLIVALF